MKRELSPDGKYLYTQFDDGSIKGEPITSEEAAQISAEDKF